MNAHTYRSNVGDFDPPPKVSGPAVFLVVTGLCAATMGGFVAGMEWQLFLVREAQKVPKARPMVANPPPPLIKCDQAGREEFFRTCRARIRLGDVK